jgi:DNA excision repair protein ERCC-4
MNVTHVIVDDRESRSDVCGYLRDMKSVTVHIQRLLAGDYLIDDTLLVERKTISDFVASIRDGRLFRQTTQLASNPIRSAFILEGTSADIVNIGMRREVVQGAIISLTIVSGIPLLRSLNPVESARLLLYAAHQLKWRRRHPVRRHQIRCTTKEKEQLYFLEGIPGIGPFRANELLKRFGSIRSILGASIEELGDVPGIGKKTIETIYRILD